MTKYIYETLLVLLGDKEWNTQKELLVNIILEF